MELVNDCIAPDGQAHPHLGVFHKEVSIDTGKTDGLGKKMRTKLPVIQFSPWYLQWLRNLKNNGKLITYNERHTEEGNNNGDTSRRRRQPKVTMARPLRSILDSMGENSLGVDENFLLPSIRAGAVVNIFSFIFSSAFNFYCAYAIFDGKTY